MKGTLSLHSSLLSTGWITATFCTGLEYSPDAVLTLTFLTLPSFPGYTSIAHPTFHFPLIAVPSCTITMSSIRTLRFSEFYFLFGTSRGNTSLVQRLQKQSMILCTNLTCFLGFFVSWKGPCRTSADALPNNISFGQRYEPSSGSFGGRPMGH